MNRLDKADVKARAAGSWRAILHDVGGIDDEVLDGRHHPCPKCGGVDRFRVFDDFEQTGGLICNQCSQDGGDGFAAV